MTIRAHRESNVVRQHNIRNGVWRPVEDAGAKAAASSSGWTSSNWSGYAIASSTNGAYNSVSATWTVPSVSSPSPNPKPKPNPKPNPAPIPIPVPDGWSFWKWLLSLFGTTRQGLAGVKQDTTDALGIVNASTDKYSATWIGIDGFNNSSLIQAGTAQNLINGKPQYYAWWEILPAAETEISPSTYPVQAGDEIQTSIAEQSDGTWTITMTNSTSGWTFTKSNIQYSGPQSSVEWIEEAPEVGGQVAPLADYGTVMFRSCTVNGSNPNLTTSESGVMVQNGHQVSTPSQPGPNHDDFTVAYGGTAPNPPTS